jgi:hypothetical protein
MIFEFIEDMVNMGLIVFCLYAVFRSYVHGRQPSWSMLLERRRLAVVSALVLSVLTLKVTEDVLGGESGPIDRVILVFVHAQVASAMTTVFEGITLSGSACALVLVVSAATLALWWVKRCHDALLLGASPLIEAEIVSIVKSPQHGAALHFAAWMSVTTNPVSDFWTTNRTLSPTLTLSSTLASFTWKTMVIGGMSRLLISPCLMVSFFASLSTLRISPSVMSAADAAVVG